MLYKCFEKREWWLISATIKDVAAAAGVSVGTVSKLINKSGYVSDKIRERVLLAITLLNYQPNAVARSLKQSKTHLLGLIVDDISNPSITKMMKSIEDAARNKSYNLIICSHNNDSDQEMKAFQWLQEKRVDGIIAIPTGAELDELQLPSSIPIMTVERKVKYNRFYSVVHENIHSSFSLVQHLYIHGCRRLLFIHGPILDHVEQERHQGIRQAIGQLGLDPELQIFLEAGTDIESISGVVRSHLGSSGLPEGIYATNRLSLAGTIQALWSMNIKVPGDVAVAGFGDIDPYGILRPTLTAAKEDFYEVGKIAAEILFERIENKMRYNQPKEFIVAPRLFIGTSCGSHSHS